MSCDELEFAKEQRGHFLYRLSCPKGIFLIFIFMSMFSVLNTLSEYIYFAYQKTLIHTLLLLIFKIVESLQCILTIYYPSYDHFTNSWND